MIFKDLKKRVNLETTVQKQSKLFERLEHKPFWIWDVQKYKREDIKSNGDCCFNHIIDLPHYDKEKYKEVTLDAAEIVLGIFGLDLLRGIRTSIRV